jgi:hypothetical protein
MHLLEKFHPFSGHSVALRLRFPPLARELACLKTTPAF